MRFVRRLQCALALVATATAAACGDGPTGPGTPPAPNFVRLQSDAGDYIGGGRTYNYTQADAVITVRANGSRLSVSIRGDQVWNGEFQVPVTLGKLRPGPYTSGGVRWRGEGRGCSTVSGSFTIDDVTYDGDELTAIDLRFQQHCEGAAAALRGTIHWRSDDTTAPPGPVDPIPASLWRPAPGSTPASGNYVYLESGAGDYIGAGRTYTYTNGFALTASAGRVSVAVNGAQRWNGDFQAMNTVNQLQPGYYGDLRRYPFHNPAKGGLSWSGEGRGCNSLAGWFAIDRVTYTNGRLTALHLRFEQHCEGDSSALHGQIHWSE